MRSESTRPDIVALGSDQCQGDGAAIAVVGAEVVGRSSRSLVAQRTATTNSLLWRVHELDPARAPKARSRDLPKHQQALRAWLITLEAIAAELALEELEDTSPSRPGPRPTPSASPT